ncbi:MAG: ankyrin repeat domain-containing protein [Eudoraea sp.]|nr:ankyrin repeat domain-containing protein [Eudoraea sp.]
MIGVGILLGMVESILFSHGMITRLIFKSIVFLIVAGIPLYFGIKIFRKKNYSKGLYLFWIIAIIITNAVVYYLEQEKFNRKYSSLKYRITAKWNLVNTPNSITVTIKNDISALKDLIKKGENLNKSNNVGQTALFFARSYDVMRLLVENGAEVNVITKTNQTLINTGQASTYHLSYQATKLFAEHGLSTEVINTKRANGKLMALHYGDICHWCDDKTYKDGVRNIKLLIELGADVNAVNQVGETPIFTVKDDSKKILFEHGANIHIKNNKNENLLFKVNDFEFFKTLIKSGLSTKVINSNGETLLHHLSNEKIVDLIASDLNIDHKNKEGRTALSWCFYNPEKLKVLVKHGADVNITDAKGNTALQKYVKDCPNAKHIKLVEVIKLLLKTNIDILNKNNMGKTALDLARYDEMKQLLSKKATLPPS